MHGTALKPCGSFKQKESVETYSINHSARPMNWSALGTGLTEDTLNVLAGVPRLVRWLCGKSCTRWYRRRLLAVSGRTDDSLEMAYFFDEQHQQTGFNVQQPGSTPVLTDAFVKQVYAYFHRGGFRASLTHILGNLVVYAFTMALIVMVVLGIDWAALWAPNHGHRHQDVAMYLRDPVRVLLQGPFSPWHVPVLMCLSAAWILWCWMAAVAVVSLRALTKMRRFYHQTLHLRSLRGVAWPAVVDAMLGGAGSGDGGGPAPVSRDTASPVDIDSLLADDNDAITTVGSAQQPESLPGPSSRPPANLLLSPCDLVAQRIMRHDNFVIALYGSGLIDDGGRVAWSQSLVWGLHVTLVDWMVSGPAVRADVLHTTVGAANKLARRFRMLAAGSAVGVVLLLPFMALHLLLRASQDVHAKRETFGPRTWTTAALWACRGYNELPHWFAKRMGAAHGHARAYVNSAASPAVSEAAAVVSYLIAAVLTVVLAILAVATEADNLTLGGRTLVWYTAVLAGALATARQFVQDPTNMAGGGNGPGPGGGASIVLPETVDSAPCRLLRAVQQHVHGLPEQWLGTADSPATRSAFNVFFRNRARVLWDELAGFATLPYVFGVVLPPRAGAIVAWASAHTVVWPGLGHVCRDAVER
jgi:autophagy-related protein 9